MKVSVSIHDAVFGEAEDLAKRLKASRSEIYSRVLGEFLGRHVPDRVTEAMNDVIAAVGDKSDDFDPASGAQRATEGGVVIEQAEVGWADLDEPSSEFQESVPRLSRRSS